MDLANDPSLSIHQRWWTMVLIYREELKTKKPFLCIFHSPIHALFLSYHQTGTFIHNTEDGKKWNWQAENYPAFKQNKRVILWVLPIQNIDMALCYISFHACEIRYNICILFLLLLWNPCSYCYYHYNTIMAYGFWSVDKQKSRSTSVYTYFQPLCDAEQLLLGRCRQVNRTWFYIHIYTHKIHFMLVRIRKYKYLSILLLFCLLASQENCHMYIGFGQFWSQWSFSKRHKHTKYSVICYSYNNIINNMLYNFICMYIFIDIYVCVCCDCEQNKKDHRITSNEVTFKMYIYIYAVRSLVIHKIHNSYGV